MRFVLIAAASVALWIGAASANPKAPTIPADSIDACLYAIGMAEKQYRIPHGLLYAIGYVESQRLGRPWPWTLNIEGAPYFFDSQAAAERRLLNPRTGNVHRNMAIGCMQILWRAHGGRVRDPVMLLDPAYNVTYGAQYLIELRDQHTTWRDATRRYHGSNRRMTIEYLCRVQAAMSQIPGADWRVLGLWACTPEQTRVLNERIEARGISPSTDAHTASLTPWPIPNFHSDPISEQRRAAGMGLVQVQSMTPPKPP